MKKQHWWDHIGIICEKPVPVPPSPPRIADNLAWDWTPASMIPGRRVNARAMARCRRAVMISGCFTYVHFTRMGQKVTVTQPLSDPSGRAV